MASIAVVGNGEGVEGSPSAIKESLADAIKGNDVAVGWYGKPAPALKAVYDHLMKEKHPFTLVHGGKVPSVFEAAEHVTLLESDNIVKSLGQLTGPKSEGGKGLILSTDDSDINTFLDYTADEVPLFDLVGLVPIEFEEEEEDEYTITEDAAPAPVVVTPDEDDDDDDIDVSGFTEEQLRGLSLRILRRIAGAPVETKDEAIAKILGEDAPEEAEVSNEPVEGDHGPVEKPAINVFETISLVRNALEEEWSSGREVSLALTKLDEAYMWLDRAVDREISTAVEEVRK